MLGRDVTDTLSRTSTGLILIWDTDLIIGRVTVDLASIQIDAGLNYAVDLDYNRLALLVIDFVVDVVSGLCFERI